MGALHNDLTAQQRAAATVGGATLVLAGAGTVKTKTLAVAVVHRIRTRGIHAHRVLVVTFTNKAAAEMAGRIQSALGDQAAPRWIGTFHGLGARQLRIEPEVAGLRQGFDILDADDSRRIVKRVMKAMRLSSDDDGMPAGRDPVKVMCNRLSKFKDNLVAPEEAATWVEAAIAAAPERRHAGRPGGLARERAGLRRISAGAARRQRSRLRRPASWRTRSTSNRISTRLRRSSKVWTASRSTPRWSNLRFNSSTDRRVSTTYTAERDR